MKTINILSRGICICKKTPKDSEGYNLEERFQFERREVDSFNYVVVFSIPLKEEADAPVSYTPPFSYDTFSYSEFNKSFHILDERNV